MPSSSGRWRKAQTPLPRGRTVVELEGHRVAVFRDDDRIFAVDAACPHAGNPLVEGDVLGTTLVCAFHGWRFDLETGACLLGELPVRRYPAELRDGELWIDLS